MNEKSKNPRKIYQKKNHLKISYMNICNVRITLITEIKLYQYQTFLEGRGFQEEKGEGKMMVAIEVDILKNIRNLQKIKI